MSCCQSESSNAPKEPAASCCCCGSTVDLDEQQERSLWIRFGAAVVVAGQGMIWGLAINLTPPAFGTPAHWALHAWLFLTALLVMVLLAGPLFSATIRSLAQGRITIEALFTLSLFGALGGSLVSTFTGVGSVYYEIVAVVLAVYTVGKQIGARSRRKALVAVEEARESFDHLYIKSCCGNRSRLPIEEIDLETNVSVMPGEGITVDGTIVEGDSFVHEMALTGEATPVVRRPGDRVLAGTHAVDGELTIRPSALKGQRQLDGIFGSIEAAREHPSELQEQADAITRWFLPTVVVVSLATFIGWFFFAPWQQALFNAMAVILVACPCALGLATPIALWGGLYRLSRLGIVSRSGRLIDALAKTRAIFFDKTGTLSESSLLVVDFVVAADGPVSRADLLRMVRRAESQLDHPVARALSQFSALQGEQAERVGAVAGASSQVTGQLKVRAGLGLQVSVQEGDRSHQTLLIGELDLMPPEMRGELVDLAHRSPVKTSKKSVYIALDGKPAGVALLDEQLRSDVRGLLQTLAKLEIKSQILTGDLSPKWAEIEGVQIDAGLSPAEKEAIVKASAEKGEYPLFVGDGTNDAPAMSHAAASLAMNESSALAQASADARLVNSALGNLIPAIETARGIRRRLKGNLLFAASYNAVGMGLAVAGILHPVVAALLMVVSSILVSSRAASAVNET